MKRNKIFVLAILLNLNIVAYPRDLTNEEIISLIQTNAGVGGLQGSSVPDELAKIGEPIYNLLSEYMLKCNNSFEEGFIVNIFIKGSGNKSIPIKAITEIQQRYEQGGELQINNWLKKRLVELNQQQEVYLKSHESQTPEPTPKPFLRPSPVSKTTPKPTSSETTAILPTPYSAAHYGWWILALIFSAVTLTWWMKRSK